MSEDAQAVFKGGRGSSIIHLLSALIEIYAKDLVMFEAFKSEDAFPSSIGRGM